VTLRARLIVALAAVSIAVIVAGYAVVTIQRRYLVDQVDRQLATSGRPAAGFALRSARAPGVTVPEPPVTRRTRQDVPSDLFDIYVARVSDNGTAQEVIVPGASRFGAPDMRGKDIAALAERGPITASAVHGSTSFRVEVVTTRADDHLVVALPLDRVEAATRRLVLVMLIAGAVIAGVLGLVCWWVVRLGLRPIRHMTDAADAIASGDLERRVADMPARTEADRLGRALNMMLDQQQSTEEHLRRFLADASHELRTPLTSIRGYMELYRRGGLRDGPALDDAMRRVDQEAGRMHDLVEDMLLLARLDEGRPLEHAPVDLTTLLRDATNDAAAVQPARPISLEVPDALITTGDENRLRQVIAALLTNALVHTDKTVPVVVRGTRVNGSCVIEVEDRGSGMPAHLAARAFGRFVRGDASRARHHGGSGLGLSIVDSVVSAHGGKVSLASQPGAGTTVRVELSQQHEKSL
jgi:two-component system OmpR family sensor kinase